MKKLMFFILISILFCSNIQSQTTKTTNLNFLLDCFTYKQIDVIEHCNNYGYKYEGIKNISDTLDKTLKFGLGGIVLHITYEVATNKCEYVLLSLTDETLFYKIKAEVMALNPVFVKTEYDGDGIISIYTNNLYKFKIITDYAFKTSVYVIAILPKS